MSTRQQDRRPSRNPVDKASIGQALESEIIPTLLTILNPDNSIKLNPQSDSTKSDYLSSATIPITDRPTFDTQKGKAAQPEQNTLYGQQSLAGFVHLLISDDDSAALASVSQLQTQGVTDQHILLNLMAPASRLLGIQWENDQINFAHVTLGVCRLHRIMRSLHSANDRTLDQSAHGGRVALAPINGEDHSFGLLMVEELLFRAGWYTDVNIDPNGPTLPDMVASNWYELAGISVSCESRLDHAAAMISEIRRCSCNNRIAIVVGGRVFSDNSALVNDLGADKVVCAGSDVVQAVARYIPTQMRT